MHIGGLIQNYGRFKGQISKRIKILYFVDPSSQYERLSIVMPFLTSSPCTNRIAKEAMSSCACNTNYHWETSKGLP